MITTFVHRAEAALRTIENVLRERNELLRDAARANTRMDGTTSREVLYFTQMGIAYADNLAALTDDGLAFLRLLHDQVHNYGNHRFASGAGFRKFVISDEKTDLMPPADYLQGYPDQFVDFSEKPKPKKGLWGLIARRKPK